MWGWLKPLLEALLNYFTKLAKEPTYAQDADPGAGGKRRHFRTHIRAWLLKQRDLGT